MGWQGASWNCTWVEVRSRCQDWQARLRKQVGPKSFAFATSVTGRKRKPSFYYAIYGTQN